MEAVAAAPLENFDAIDVAIVVGQAEVDQKTASEVIIFRSMKLRFVAATQCAKRDQGVSAIKINTLFSP
mgnify:CR=1 FL=1